MYDINVILDKLISSDPSLNSKTSLAAKIGVSEATVSRWRDGTAQPQPSSEKIIRELASKLNKQHSQRFSVDISKQAEDRLRTALSDTFRDLREVLHRSGRLSTRHEALSELSKLLFAHFLAVENGAKGITSDMASGSSSATQLIEFVNSSFDRMLPDSLELELEPNDFYLKFRASENEFASDLIGCFRRLNTAEFEAKISGPDGIDILNETFGNFLADSFVDEKELGQYLTPTEVVQFMVRLALYSLEPEDYNLLCDPKRCNEFGVILDPSCGVGSFLDEILQILFREIVQSKGQSEVDLWLKSMMEHVIIGIDKSERMIRLALTNLALFGVPSVKLFLENALSKEPGKVTTNLEGKVKLILTNPPFGAEFTGESLKSFQLFNVWSNKKPQKIDSELLFLERYIDWLAPGGHLLTIVPDSVLTNKGLFADLRQGLGNLVELQNVISLPSVTFAAAGTSTKTSILHLTKKIEPGSTKSNEVYFSICQNIGYEIVTRGSHRKKMQKIDNDLNTILLEACDSKSVLVHGQRVNFDQKNVRWDAIYHASLPPEIAVRLSHPNPTDIFVKDIARLVKDTFNPMRLPNEENFQYIEISDVDSQRCTVGSKSVLPENAPSRARKRVRAGDILVSTVRPERRSIAVVPSSLDGAICSTGFAVLRLTDAKIHPLVLAKLMQSDFVNSQLLRNNVGIAYPAIEEAVVLDLLLPINKQASIQMSKTAQSVDEQRSIVSRLESELDTQVATVVAM